MITRFPSVREVRIYVADLIRAGQPHIEDRMKQVQADIAALNVRSSFSANIQTQQFPLTQIDQREGAFEWRAMQSQIRTTFRAQIWAYVHGYEPDVNADLIAELATGIVDVICSRHVARDTGKGFSIYYEDKSPISRVQFGVTEASGNRVAAAILDYACDVVLSVPDEP